MISIDIVWYEVVGIDSIYLDYVRECAAWFRGHYQTPVIKYQNEILLLIRFASFTYPQ